MPLVDKIALCAAGYESQSVFDAPTHRLAGAMDEARIIERLARRDDGSGKRTGRLCTPPYSRRRAASFTCLCSRHGLGVVNNSPMLAMSGEEDVALSPLNMRLAVADFTL